MSDYKNNVDITPDKPLEKLEPDTPAEATTEALDEEALGGHATEDDADD